MVCGGGWMGRRWQLGFRRSRVQDSCFGASHGCGLVKVCGVWGLGFGA